MPLSIGLSEIFRRAERESRRKDLAPGIYVRGIGRQIQGRLGLRPDRDYDIIQDRSWRGGERSPAEGWWGPTVHQGTPRPPTQTPVGDFIGPDRDPRGSLSSGGGSLARAAEEEAALRELRDRRAYIEPIFRDQIARDRATLDSDSARNRERLRSQYQSQREAMKEGFNRANLQSKAHFAAMGAADSTGMRQWLADNQAKHDRGLSDLNVAETDQLNQMEMELTKARRALDVAENNFFRELPQFNSLEEIVSYGNALADQKIRVQNALAQVRETATRQRAATATRSSAEVLMDMYEGVAKIRNAVRDGALPNQAADSAIAQWVSQFYTNPEDAESIIDQIINRRGQ